MTGPLGPFSYTVFYNPYHVIKRAHLDGKMQERKWQALVVRATEVTAFDLDDIDDSGELILSDDEVDEEDCEVDDTAKTEETANPNAKHGNGLAKPKKVPAAKK